MAMVQKTTPLHSAAVLFLFAALCVGGGGLIGYATADPVDIWFPGLVKPAWNPPSWLFAPVWTTLYTMMGVAAWLVWKRRWDEAAAVKWALILFFVQLAFNFAWSLLFFGLKSPALALIDIAALWIALILTVYAFFGVSKPAGLLMLPYLAWVSFAAALNFAIWQLN